MKTWQHWLMILMVSLYPFLGSSQAKTTSSLSHAVVEPKKEGPVIRLGAMPAAQGVLDHFYQQLFMKAGYQVELVDCQTARCSDLAHSGLLQGDAARAESYSRINPDMQRVGLPLYQDTLKLVTTTEYHDSEPTSALMRGNALLCLRGSLWCKEHEKELKIIWFDRPAQGFSMLLKKRADMLIASDTQEGNHIPASWQGQALFSRVIGHTRFYLFLNRQHGDVIRNIEQAWEALQQSGEWGRWQESIHQSADNNIAKQFAEQE